MKKGQCEYRIVFVSLARCVLNPRENSSRHFYHRRLRLIPINKRKYVEGEINERIDSQRFDVLF